MKTCGYCGRENEDEAAVCRECGQNEFPVPQKVKTQVEQTPFEAPVPDVQPDQEAALCPFCLFPNLPERQWCKQCGAPLNISTFGSFESAVAVGGMWRGVVRGRPRWWVMLFVWCCFAPLFVAGAIGILAALLLGQLLLMPMFLIPAFVGFSMLYQVTRNYLKIPKIKFEE